MDKALNIALAILFGVYILIGDFTISVTTKDTHVKRTLKFQGAIMYLLYKTHGMSDEAYFLSYKSEVFEEIGSK